MKTSKFSKAFAGVVFTETALCLSLPFIVGRNTDTNNVFLIGVGSALTIVAFFILIHFRDKLKALAGRLPFHGGVKFVFLGWFISVFVFELVFFFYNVLMGRGPNFLTGNLLPSTPFYLIYFSSWWYFRSRYKFSYEELFYLFGLSGLLHEQVILGYGVGAPGFLILLGGILNVFNYGAMIVPTAYLSGDESRDDLPRPRLRQKILAVVIPSAFAFALGLFLKNAG